jgi:hypothetical protein
MDEIKIILSLIWDGSVHIDESREHARASRSDPSDHHPSVAMPNQNQVSESVLSYDFCDLYDMSVETHGGIKKVILFSHSGQAGSKDAVSSTCELVCDSLPRRPTHEATMY